MDCFLSGDKNLRLDMTSPVGNELQVRVATLKAAGSNHIVYLLVQQLDDRCEVLDAKVWRPKESGIVDMSITLNHHFRKLIFTAMVENETGETIPPYTWTADFHFFLKS